MTEEVKNTADYDKFMAEQKGQAQSAIEQVDPPDSPPTFADCEDIMNSDPVAEAEDTAEYIEEHGEEWEVPPFENEPLPETNEEFEPENDVGMTVLSETVGEPREESFLPEPPTALEDTHRRLLLHPDAGGLLSDEDWHFIDDIVGHDSFGLNEPDKVIDPDGKPYLFRWWIAKSDKANIYLHVFTDSDPDWPMHDHPYDTSSLIISGGCEEVIGRVVQGRVRDQRIVRLKAGDMKTRAAADVHRIMLANGCEYMVSVFTTGPVVREWGYYTPNGWVQSDEYFEMRKAGVHE